jgi:hypothetical protein
LTCGRRGSAGAPYTASSSRRPPCAPSRPRLAWRLACDRRIPSRARRSPHTSSVRCVLVRGGAGAAARRRRQAFFFPSSQAALGAELAAGWPWPSPGRRLPRLPPPSPRGERETVSPTFFAVHVRGQLPRAMREGNVRPLQASAICATAPSAYEAFLQMRHGKLLEMVSSTNLHFLSQPLSYWQLGTACRAWVGRRQRR